jgi:hypothetical protein
MSPTETIAYWQAEISTHLPHLSRPQAAVLALWSYGMVVSVNSDETLLSPLLRRAFANFFIGGRGRAFLINSVISTCTVWDDPYPTEQWEFRPTSCPLDRLHVHLEFPNNQSLHTPIHSHMASNYLDDRCFENLQILLLVQL